MENVNWSTVTMVGIVTIMAIGTLFAIGCLLTGSIQWIMTWLCSDYILGMVVGLFALAYLRKSIRDKSKEDEEA